MYPVLTRTVNFLNRLDMVEIMGKWGRKVPVILTAEMTRSIDLLIKTRKPVGIQERNPYIFARPNRQSLQYMRAWDCLRKFSTQCEPPLSNPANVTSTKLSKYTATISQVLSMEEKRSGLACTSFVSIGISIGFTNQRLKSPNCV